MLGRLLFRIPCAALSVAFASGASPENLGPPASLPLRGGRPRGKMNPVAPEVTTLSFNSNGVPGVEILWHKKEGSHVLMDVPPWCLEFACAVISHQLLELYSESNLSGLWKGCCGAYARCQTSRQTRPPCRVRRRPERSTAGAGRVSARRGRAPNSRGDARALPGASGLSNAAFCRNLAPGAKVLLGIKPGLRGWAGVGEWRLAAGSGAVHAGLAPTLLPPCASLDALGLCLPL